MAQPLNEKTTAKTAFVLEARERNSLCILAGEDNSYLHCTIKCQFILSEVVSNTLASFCLKKGSTSYHLTSTATLVEYQFDSLLLFHRCFLLACRVLSHNIRPVC